MEYISSDTNVWLDFMIIDRLELPFRLPYIYLMSEDMADDELLSPRELNRLLQQYGLKKTELTEAEFYYIEELQRRYKRLSVYDCAALAIAKKRKIALLTGDSRLRSAAQAEHVQVTGTIGILDSLYDGKYINHGEYFYCLMELMKNNGRRVRLPEDELRLRIDALGDEE